MKKKIKDVIDPLVDHDWSTRVYDVCYLDNNLVVAKPAA